MTAELPLLTRADRDAPEVRMVHLGLGNFHRAHQAWYTARADPDWGIAALTGRRPDAAQTLSAQGCRYTLIERHAGGDRYTIIDSIVEAHDASATATLRALISRPAVSVITLTVTEKGYRLTGTGSIDNADTDVASDIDTLTRALSDDSDVADGILRTMPGRLVWALDGRRRAEAGVLSVIPCDNLSDNANAARASIWGLAVAVSASLAEWIDANVDFIGTSVDRITPQTTPGDIVEVARECGYLDNAPVITEPFSSWILSGRFRADRPHWEYAGAVFVASIDAFERRKLWMLNGAHSLLAYAGLSRGHSTVAEAIDDDFCAAAVNALWDLDECHLGGDPELRLSDYRRDLETRFRNPAIAHYLRQIAIDGSVKLPNRVVEVVRSARANGNSMDAGLRVIAVWIRFLHEETAAGRAVADARADEITASMEATDPTEELLRMLSPELAADHGVLARLQELALENHGV